MTIKKEAFTYSIALIIISSYIVFFAVVMYQSPSKTIDDLKTITATFGTIVAAIIGYYFGQRPAEQATKSAEETRTKRKDEQGAGMTETKKEGDYWKEVQEIAKTLNSNLGEQ